MKRKELGISPPSVILGDSLFVILSTSLFVIPSGAKDLTARNLLLKLLIYQEQKTRIATRINTT